MRRRRARRRLVVLAVAVTLVVGIAATAQTRWPVELITATGAGVADPDGAETLPADAEAALTINLPLRDLAAAERLAAQVSDPADPGYGRFLTQAQFTDRFAIRPDLLARLRDWLSHEGLTITATSPSRRWVRVQAHVTALERAFRTTFRSAPSDTVGWVPSRPPTVPRELAGAVESLGGLTPLDPGVTETTVPGPPPPAFRRPDICSPAHGLRRAEDDPRTRQVPPSYAGTPLAVCGYTARQLRAFYGASALTAAGVDGRGATVAVIGAYRSPTLEQDTQRWAARQGEPVLRPGQLRVLPPARFSYGSADHRNGDACDEPSWYTEQTMDVEAVHGMAPGADIAVVPAVSCQLSDLYEAVQRVLDESLAPIVSCTFSTPADALTGADLASAHATFVQAVVQGVGLYASSGDAGDNLIRRGARTVTYPAADPWVTAVGGTSIGVSATGARIFEVGWQTAASELVARRRTPAASDAFDAGGGGGVSRTFAQPAYQKGVVPADVSQYFGGTPGRAVPDLAAVADPATGYLIGQTQLFPDGRSTYVELRVGGTSLATPLVAAVMALAQQARGIPLGFAAPALYRLAGTPAFHDIVPAPHTIAVITASYRNDRDPSGGTQLQLRTFDTAQTIHTRAGYDDETGLGTPDARPLVMALARQAAGAA